MSGDSRFDIEIPLFAVRRGLASGLASATHNLVVGLVGLGKRVNLPYTMQKRLPPEFARLRENPDSSISFQKYPHVRGGMPTRFIEESYYAHSSHRSRNILFPNYFLPPRLVKRGERISVLIHDCQPFVFPGFFSSRKVAWVKWNFRRSLRHADHLLVISEFEKGQLCRFFGDELGSRCHVIYNAIDWSRYERSEVSEETVRLGERTYLLSVAHQAPHKNVLKVIQAFLKLPAQYHDLNLILVGKPSEETKSYLRDRVAETARRRVVLTGYLPDADLGYLYRNTALFILASSYEGFGMPAVEAMGLGVHTLLANGTALPEVTLRKADYCPEDSSPDIWARAMAQSLENRKAPEEYHAFAQDVRRLFSPVAVARRLLRALEGETDFGCLRAIETHSDGSGSPDLSAG